MESELMINSNLVKQLRKNAGWSQEQLAHASGLSLRTIQRVEAEGKASLETKVCLSATLQVKLAELEVRLPETTNSPKKPQLNNVFVSVIGIAMLFTIIGFFFDMPIPIIFLSNITALFGLIFIAFWAFFTNEQHDSSWPRSAVTGSFICASLFSIFGLFGDLKSNAVLPLLLSVMLFSAIYLLHINISQKQKFGRDKDKTN